VTSIPHLDHISISRVPILHPRTFERGSRLSRLQLRAGVRRDSRPVGAGLGLFFPRRVRPVSAASDLSNHVKQSYIFESTTRPTCYAASG
jgi:hypothetical protein